MTAHPFVLDKLERVPLSEQAVQSLLGYIERSRLAPGAALPGEGRLAEILGVSRPVVREALRTLKGMGVVDIANGKSPIIRRDLDATAMSIYFARALQVLDNSTEDLMAVRAALEGQSAALAAARRQPAQIERMTALVTRMQGCLHDPATYAALDTELHVEIARASGNPLLWQMIGSIRASLESQSRQGMERRKTRKSLQQVQDGHAELVARICEGDVAGAAASMQAHMAAALHALLREPQA
ncbi:FadR/GntR family transcriptional regulator [Variovorax sp. Varisp41]|jgi:GntR family transcriptional repressor for pyruvate dehydrogenase complex|uniref:FadR/GntR family transcriptional regulator n=1 Tax=unclassified Variovorax TaxID=663243 RepID=UPI000AE684BE